MFGGLDYRPGKLGCRRVCEGRAKERCLRGALLPMAENFHQRPS